MSERWKAIVVLVLTLALTVGCAKTTPAPTSEPVPKASTQPTLTTVPPSDTPVLPTLTPLPTATSAPPTPTPPPTEPPIKEPTPTPTQLPPQPAFVAEVVASLEGLPIDEFFEESYRQLLFRNPEKLTALGAAESFGLRNDRLNDLSDAYIRETQELEAAGLSPQIAEYFDSYYEFTLCESWQSGQADPVENTAVVSDIPALILAGQFDPVTPPEWGRLAAETLSHYFFYEFPGLGHGIMRSNACGLEIGLQFIDDPTTEPDVSCLADESPPDFK